MSYSVDGVRELADTAVSGSTAGAPAVRIVEVRAGLGGRFKVGYWTPLEVTLEADEEAVAGLVELTVPDGDGVPSLVPGPPQAEVQIAAGAQAAVMLYAKIGQLSGGLVVGFRGDSGQLLASRTFRPRDPPLDGVLPSTRGLIVSLGGPLVARDAVMLADRGADIAQVRDFAHLPADWWGYEGVDAVILATDSASLSDQLVTDSPQMAALDAWVAMGGRLIVSLGSQSEKILRSESRLTRMVPGRFDSFVPLRQTTPFETYAETSEPLSPGAGFAMQVPKLVDVRGKIEAYAGGHSRDLPLVVRAPYGFGEVTFLAFDLGQAPLALWPARSQLVEKILALARTRGAQNESGSLGQVTTLGFEDLSGQLRAALDQFEAVKLIPFWLVALLIAAYIVCIGPLDYFVVKRVFRRMEATWFTFALTVVAFSVGAYFLAYGLKGRELRINRIDLVDFDAAGGTARGTSWATLFSPEIAAYDLAIRPLPPPPIAPGDPRSSQSNTAPAAALPPIGSGELFSWFGLPGTGFGGMDAAAPGVQLFDQPYRFARRLDQLDRVPIAVWSTKSFVGRWWRAQAAPVAADLRQRDKLLGTLTSHLSEPLDDCVLFHERWAYPIRQLRPGKTIHVETDLDPQRADTYLRHVTVQGDRNVSLPYDRASFDVGKIIEIMSAHELAGGEKYTSLTNAYQGFIDLSALVNDGRAVLIGRSGAAATTLEGQDRALDDVPGAHWTYHRYVFPVETQTSP